MRMVSPWSSPSDHDGTVTVTVSAGAQAYLGARAAVPFGDMMIDGVPRGAGCAAALSFEADQQEHLAAVPVRERAARASGSAGSSRLRPRCGSLERGECVLAQGA